MPHPCSHWAVWTFGKVDPSRRTFDSVTDITDEYRAELASEEAKLGRPDLPKLVYERGDIDLTKKQKKSEVKAVKAIEAQPAFSASALDGAATVSDDAWAQANFAVGRAVVATKGGKDQERIIIEKVEGQTVTLKGANGKMTTTTRTAVMEAYVARVNTTTQATRWVPMRVPHTRRRRRRRRRGGDVHAVT